MNYQMLKTLLDSLILNFKCPNCSQGVTDSNLEIVWAAWTNINLDILCPNCDKHTFVKTEVSQINLGNITEFNKEKIEELKQKLHNKLTNINIKHSDFPNQKSLEAKINDKEILEIRDVLKQDNIDVWDFLKDQ